MMFKNRVVWAVITLALIGVAFEAYGGQGPADCLLFPIFDPQDGSGLYFWYADSYMNEPDAGNCTSTGAEIPMDEYIWAYSSLPSPQACPDCKPLSILLEGAKEVARAKEVAAPKITKIKRPVKRHVGFADNVPSEPTLGDGTPWVARSAATELKVDWIHVSSSTGGAIPVKLYVIELDFRDVLPSISRPTKPVRRLKVGIEVDKLPSIIVPPQPVKATPDPKTPSSLTDGFVTVGSDTYRIITSTSLGFQP